MIKHSLTLFCVILLIISFQPSIYAGDGSSSIDPIFHDEGIYEGELNENEEVWFQINSSLGKYTIELTGSSDTDFDLYLYDENLEEITSSQDVSYPETLLHYVGSETKIFVKIASYSGSGTYTLNVMRDDLKVVTEDGISGNFTPDITQEFYKIDVETGIYNVSLLGSENTFFDFDLVSTDLELLATSNGYSYPETLLYHINSSQDLLIRVNSNGYEGTFDLFLNISNIQLTEPGIHTDIIDYSETVEYNMLMKKGRYIITLTAQDNTDFDLYLDTINGDAISYSENEVYPEIITYTNLVKNLVTIQVYSYSGAGEFELKIEEILHEPVPEGYTEIDSNGIDIYQLTGVKEQTISLSLEMSGDIFYVAITDTNLDLAVYDALITEPDELFNPHNLADSFTTYEGVYDIHHLDYKSDYDTIYIMVYSFNQMTDQYSTLPSGYNLTSNFPLSPTSFNTNYEEAFPYDNSGRIDDNGDQYWNDGEFVIYQDYTLPTEEVFDMVISASGSTEIIIILFQGTTEEDINYALEEFNDYYQYDEPLPSDIYSATITSGGLGFLSYRHDTNLSFNVAVFLNSPIFSSSVSYTLITSHDNSGGVIADAAGVDDAPFFIPLFILAIL